MKYPTNSDILSPNPRLGWVTDKEWSIAAVPMGTGKKYMVIYDNCKMKVCRTNRVQRTLYQNCKNVRVSN